MADKWGALWLIGSDMLFLLAPSSSKPWTFMNHGTCSQGEVGWEDSQERRKTRTKTKMSRAIRYLRDFLNLINHFTDGKAEAQRGRKTLLKSYSDQVCSYDSQTFCSNSTNTNSNNFNLLEVDDVSMSVPNLSFSAPNDKEKDKRILYLRLLCDSLCQTNLESKNSCPGHEIAHTHTLNSILLGSLRVTHLPSRESPPEGRDLPLYPSIKLNTLHQSSFCTWTLYFPLPAPLTSLDQLSLRQADCLPHWPKHSLCEAARMSLHQYTFPLGVMPLSLGSYSHRTPAGRAWSLPIAPEYLGC